MEAKLSKIEEGNRNCLHGPVGQVHKWYHCFASMTASPTEHTMAIKGETRYEMVRYPAIGPWSTSTSSATLTRSIADGPAGMSTSKNLRA